MQYPLQKVEQDRGHHSGLSGNSGATRDSSQEVEQDRGGCCVTPGSADPSAEVRQRSELVTEPGSRRSPSGVLAIEVMGGARLP